MSVLLNATLNGIIGLTLVFIACEIGQKMNDSYDEVSSTVDHFAWYLFPIKIQQMYPMIIVNAQEPIILECFGSIACSREVFKNVTKYKQIL